MQDVVQQVTPILKQYNVQKASLFGSYATGNQTDQSDVDILIQPPKGMGLSFVTLKLDLEKKLGKKVDLVSFRAINKHVKKYILEDQVPIL